MPAPRAPLAAADDHVKLWDLPVRLVHWAIVVLLPWQWWTHETNDIELHKLLGYVTLGLVVFRLLWGVVGSSTARFGHFVKGPGGIGAYLRALRANASEPVVGHNPLGGWSVIALLALLTAQVALGLFAQDVDGIESGPLSYLVSYDQADAAREWHETVFNLMLAAIALHVVAIVWYLAVKRDNLLAPMITGRKRFDQPVQPPALAAPWRMVPCAFAAAAFAWWIALGCPLPGAAG
ncbi:MAG: cytochrome b/b6 domain-containing protein [Novosphingobium sp.]